MGMNYEKMIALNRVESDQKVKLAIQAINSMVESREYPSVAELVKMTGLSRGFFYKNKTVREYLDNAVKGKFGVAQNLWRRSGESEGKELFDLRQEVLEQKAENKRLIEEKQMLEKQISELQKKVSSLEKKVNKKEIALLKRL